MERNQDCFAEFCYVYVEFEWSVFSNELTRPKYCSNVHFCLFNKVCVKISLSLS